MSAVPAAAYLADFGREAMIAGKATLVPQPLAREAGPSAAEIAARIDAAHAGGFESGKAAALAELEHKLQAQQVAHEELIAAERQAWASAEGERLAELIGAGLAEIEGRIADTVGRILQPFLGTALRRRAVGDLRAELEALLAKEPGISISITGPQDLLDEMRQRLDGKTQAATYHAAEGVDLRVEAGQSVLETRLGAWLTKMQEAAQ
jgi:hypothetical protein